MPALHAASTPLRDMPTLPSSPTEKHGFGSGRARAPQLVGTLLALLLLLGGQEVGVAAASPGGDPAPTERALGLAPAGAVKPTQDDASSSGKPSADPSDPFTRGAELRELAQALRVGGNPVEALEPAMEAEALLSQALRLARTAADSLAVTLELAEARNQLGLNLWILSRFQEAVQFLEEARILWLPLDYAEGLGRVHNNLGVVYYQWGSYDLALESFLEALPYRETQADTAGMARVLSNIGLVRLDWRQFDEAEEALEQAAALADATGEPGVRAYAW